MGPLIPLFWASGDVCPGFQSQVGSLVCFLTSRATPADCRGQHTSRAFSIHLLADVSTSIGGGARLPRFETELIATREKSPQQASIVLDINSSDPSHYILRVHCTRTTSFVLAATYLFFPTTEMMPFTGTSKDLKNLHDCFLS